jgi:hypothetical protein
VRTTIIPPLGQLPCGFTIQRCVICGEMAFSDEICFGENEASACRF